MIDNVYKILRNFLALQICRTILFIKIVNSHVGDNGLIAILQKHKQENYLCFSLTFNFNVDSTYFLFFFNFFNFKNSYKINQN